MTLLFFTSCQKDALTNPTDTQNKTKTNVLFYTGGTYTVNCPIDSVFIYVDSTSIGTLLLNDRDDSKNNKLITTLNSGTHNYYAMFKSCSSGYWKDQVVVTATNDTIKVLLDLGNIKR